jgi:hypothetical protein
VGKLKALLLDSGSSPITKRVYNMALDEFMGPFREVLKNLVGPDGFEPSTNGL